MIKLFKDNKGLTLVELIVVMVVSSIIVTSVAGILPSILSMYKQANELAERNTLLNNVANQIISDLKDATKPIEGLPAQNKLPIVAGTNEITYEVSGDGILLKNNNAVWSKSYYRKKSAQFTCELAEDSPETAYILTISISSDTDGGSISRDFAVTPLVLNQR